MTVRGREIRRISALLLLSLLSAALLAGCLGASQANRSAEASAGTASGSPGETPKKSTSGGVPESTVGASHIEGDLAETNDASSRIPFVEKTEDIAAVWATTPTRCSRCVTGFTVTTSGRSIDLGTGEEPTGTVPSGL